MMALFEHNPHSHKTQNLNEVHDSTLTFGDRVSDNVASYVGSWRFVLIMTGTLITWLAWNSMPFLPHFDNAPFILLNLCLSFIAGYTAPFIIMSQNRQASKDRLAAEHNYLITEKAEDETRQLIRHLYEQDKQLVASYEELLKQTTMLLEIAQKGR